MSASLHSTNSMRRTILAILIVLGVIVIDQLIKFDIKTTFMLHEDYVVARDWFHILLPKIVAWLLACSSWAPCSWRFSAW